MTTADRVARSAGPTVDVPTDNLAAFVFSNPFQHLPNNFASPSTGIINPDHTFDGQAIAPQRPSLVHAGTGAALTWERLQADSLRVARSISALVGPELPFDGQDNGRAIHSPRTTVLLCLPNCLAFAPILLGSWAALCTVSTVNSLLMPQELANILAKSRPQLLFVAAGKEGEGRMRDALDLVLKGEVAGLDSKLAERTQKWARELDAAWQAGQTSQYMKGDQLPPASRRVWTVNVGTTYAGSTDYYGSSARRDGVSALSDRRDWCNLLAPPPGHRHGESLDVLSRSPFAIRKLSKAEQRRRTALILWSSGTTGPSKGVLISHGAFVASVLSLWYSLPILHGPLRGGETWVALVPWSHTYGLGAILLSAIAIGATLVIPSNPRFDLADYMAVVKRYRVTHLHVAPPVVVHLRNYILQQQRCNAIDPSVLSSVRAISSGGAPTSYAAVQSVYEALGKPVHQAYGSTECGSTAHATAASYDADNIRAQEEIGSVGTPLINVEIAIHLVEGCKTLDEINRRRADVIKQVESSGLNGRPRSHRLHDSVPGEIWLRAPSVMQGYYSGFGSDERREGALDLAMTERSITADGWFKTGDEGMIDGHGQLWIVGRIKELIKVKGFQVAPVELDATFGKHERVVDAAAVGVQDHDDGEEICMYIVPQDEHVLKQEQAQAALARQLTEYIVNSSV